MTQQVEELDASDGGSRTTSTPFGLAAARIGEGGSTLRMSTIGRFEAWTCHDCGYTEFYARDFAPVFAQLAANPQSGVRFIDAGAPPQRPHR